MVERYEYPEMSKIFSEQHRFETYLKIEKLCTAAFYNFDNVISEEGYDNIVNCDETIDVNKIKYEETFTKHEIFAFIYYINNRLNKEGKKYFHYGLTSSDILDTGNSVIIKEANDLIKPAIEKLIKTLYNKAVDNKEIMCVGRTHGQSADFTTMGLRFLQWTDEIIRQYHRFIAAASELEQCKISGAIGNYLNINPEIEKYVAQTLGLKTDYLNTQIVSRDIYSNYFSVLGNFASSIDKLTTDIRSLARSEINELQEGFTCGQRGSSAMPHKHNPVSCENLSGCARLMRGYVVSSMENIVLWDERDMSNSITERFVSNDMIQLFYYMIKRFTDIITNLRVNKHEILRNIELTGERMYSQDILKILINDGGYTRLEAYDVVKKCAEEAERKHTRLTTEIMDFVQSDTLKHVLAQQQYYVVNSHKVYDICNKLFEQFNVKYKTIIE